MSHSWLHAAERSSQSQLRDRGKVLAELPPMSLQDYAAAKQNIHFDGLRLEESCSSTRTPMLKWHQFDVHPRRRLTEHY